MFRFVNPGPRTIAAAALLGTVVFAGPVRASDPAPATQAAAPAPAAMTKHTAAERVDARIASLHDKLKITDAQAPQWNALAHVMQENEHKIHALIQARHEKSKTMTAVDDLRSYGEITEAHAQGLRTLVPAFEALYDTMSPEQKKNADIVFDSYEGRPPAEGK